MIVVSLSQKIHGFNSNINWYGLQISRHWEAFNRVCKDCWQIESKVTRNSGGKLGSIMGSPEGCNKIQDKYKSEKFVVVGKCPVPNVYCIKLVNGNGPEWTVNQCQLQDLGKTQNDGGLISSQNNHDGVQVQSFNPKLINTNHPQCYILMSLAQKGYFQCIP